MCLNRHLGKAKKLAEFSQAILHKPRNDLSQSQHSPFNSTRKKKAIQQHLYSKTTQGPLIDRLSFYTIFLVTKAGLAHLKINRRNTHDCISKCDRIYQSVESFIAARNKNNCRNFYE